VADKKQFTKIPKPADFKPKKYFPKNWKDARLRGKPRCPGWARSSGQQCGKLAGHGTDRLGEAGACCKAHGGASKGAPVGSTNAVKPDKPHSQYVRLKDLPGLMTFRGMSDEEKADLLANIMLSRIEKALNAHVDTDEADSKPADVDGKLIALTTAANSSLRTKVAVRRLAAEIPPDPDENLTDEQLERELFGEPGTVPGDAEE